MSEINPQYVDASEQKDSNVPEKTPTVGVEKSGVTSHDVTGLAVVEQGHVIPTTGERKVTTRLEYWSYCLYGQ